MKEHITTEKCFFIEIRVIIILYFIQIKCNMISLVDINIGAIGNWQLGLPAITSHTNSGTLINS